MAWHKEELTKTLHPIIDAKMQSMKKSWYHSCQVPVTYKEFIEKSQIWFQSSQLNDLQNLQSLSCIDVTMGCTHYIESLVLKYGWHGFQILKNEYAYYTLMGKYGVDPENLEANKPLIITLPHWQFCDLRPEWPMVLKICEQRNIDIHIDMAWIITARDITIDFSHPCIKSVGMSLSKLNLQWSRIGLRFCRQKSMDSVTIFNDYYQDTNTVLTSVGNFWIENFERDYLWKTYGRSHHDLCESLGLQPSKIIHVVHDPADSNSIGIGRCLGKSTPDNV